MDMFISYRKRVDDLQDNLDELDEDDEDNDEDSEVQEALQYFVKKGKNMQETWTKASVVFKSPR